MLPPLRAIAVLAGALGALTAGAFALQAHDREDRLPDADLTAQRYAVPRLAAGVPRGPRLQRVAAATGIPAPAVRAYARAELTAPRGCGVGWTTLAGIGYVESHHGTLGGRSLLADGHSSSPILGPALDGRGDFAAIRSTPTSRALHGDPVWEHAVGPMQFLPGTWRLYAADGDGDGDAEALDLDDAAATAARYLCSGGRDLHTSVGWEKAVLAYNHSGAYVDDVYAAASSYATRADR
ncbi:lytic murein transglycosylase [Nocardioides sp. MAHUQ-72]|uniref:lytic murein transglycosylase n=1 Tax=unclassified Nocardioides TaxID=2615069 RepID=UPI00362358F2